MVTVELFRRERDDCLIGFKALGHSGYAPDGEDIVCAAVSALLTVAVIGLHSRFRLFPNVKSDEHAGLLECTLDIDSVNDTMKRRVEDLLETIALGLIEIEREYGKYLSVKEVIV